MSPHYNRWDKPIDSSLMCLLQLMCEDDEAK